MIFKIIVALILAISLLIMMYSLMKKGAVSQEVPETQAEKTYRICPLCGHDLKRGETVHSHLYPGRPDGMMHIFGCPFCFKDHPKAMRTKKEIRICPFCKKVVSEKGWVVARVFEKPNKTHIHVLGCTECRKLK